MAKKKIPAALKAHQFGKKKGASPTTAGKKGGKKSPAKKANPFAKKKS